jgi:hypothetical protein
MSAPLAVSMHFTWLVRLLESAEWYEWLTRSTCSHFSNHQRLRMLVYEPLIPGQI